MIKFLAFLLITMALPLWKAMGQLDNRNFEERLSMPGEAKNSLYLHLHTLGFARNNEYFNPVVGGETLFGYQWSTSLLYYPIDNLKIEAGIFLWKDFGTSEYTQISPIFRLHYKKDSTSILFGNLRSNLAHRLTEPLYGFEQGIRRPLENGLQVIHHRPHWYADLWVDWLVRTFKGADFQEEIFGGLHLFADLIENDFFSLTLPLQLTVYHRGGQDINVNRPFTNLFNVNTGMRAEWKSQETAFVKSIAFEPGLVFSSESLDDSVSVSRQGKALYLNLYTKTKWVDLLLSFWSANEFNSFAGGEIYRSLTVREAPEGKNQPFRRLLFFRLLKDFRINEDFSISARFEPVYDFELQKLETSAGLYFHYRPRFLLKKF